MARVSFFEHRRRRGLQICLGRFHRLTGLEPADHSEPIVAGCVPLRIRRVRHFLEGQGKNDVSPLPGDQSLKSCRQHANNCDRTPVDVERSSDNRLAPLKMLLPVLVTEDRLVPVRTAPRHVIRITKYSTQVRTQLEYPETITRHQGAAYARHSLVLSNREIDSTPSQKVTVHGLVLTQRIIGRPGDGKVWHALLAKHVPYQLSRIRHGQAFQDHRVRQAEDGRVYADAKRQRYYGDGGEAGVLRQHPQAVAKVLNQ